MNVQEVTDLMAITDKILTWRRNAQRESTRIRVERVRQKLREAGPNGDTKAVRKPKKIKKADALRSAKYRKHNRKEKLLRK